LKEDVGEGESEGEGEGEGEGENKEGESEGENKEGEGEGEGEQKEGSEKIIKMSEKVAKTLEKNAKEGVKAMAILRKKEVEGIVGEFTFSELNQKGLLLPKSKDKTVAFLLSLSEKQRKEFSEILNEIPKSKLFSELGKESGIPVNASERVEQLAQEKIAKDDSLEYRQALEQVFAENPELAESVEQS